MESSVTDRQQPSTPRNQGTEHTTQPSTQLNQQLHESTESVVAVYPWLHGLVPGVGFNVAVMKRLVLMPIQCSIQTDCAATKESR